MTYVVKRYRVVRDGRGEWGVLDTYPSQYAFAPFMGEWGTALYAAKQLNVGKMERPFLFWHEYHARSDR